MKPYKNRGKESQALPRAGVAVAGLPPDPQQMPDAPETVPQDRDSAALVRRAQTGDIEAARYVRDTIGEKPTETTALQISNQPIRAMDLTQLSDAELEALADRADEED